MTGREAEILASVTGMLALAADMLPPTVPCGEEHARGWIAAAAAEIDGLLSGKPEILAAVAGEMQLALDLLRPGGEAV